MATPRPSVTQEVFLEAALRIVDDIGPEALTTRTLGHAVGLDSTTVYRYFGSKDVLLGTLFDYVLGQALRNCNDMSGSPEERMRTLIHEYRLAFFAHPSTARLNSQMADMVAAGLGESPNTIAFATLAIEILSEWGLSGENLLLGFEMAEMFIVGAVIQESGARNRGMGVRTGRLTKASTNTDAPTLDEESVEVLSNKAFDLGVEGLFSALRSLRDTESESLDTG